MSDIRYYNILNKLSDEIYQMTINEAKGAQIVLSILHNNLYKIHFEYKEQINIKALVKTIEELYEVSYEKILNEIAPT
jgi:hypothetical protein